MGFVDFVKSAGRKVGIFGDRKDPKLEEAKAAAEEAKKASLAAGDAAARQVLEQKLLAADIRAAILSFVPVEELIVTFDGGGPACLAAAMRGRRDGGRRLFTPRASAGAAHAWRAVRRVSACGPKAAAGPLRRHGRLRRLRPWIHRHGRRIAEVQRLHPQRSGADNAQD